MTTGVEQLAPSAIVTASLLPEPIEVLATVPKAALPSLRRDAPVRTAEVGHVSVAGKKWRLDWLYSKAPFFFASVPTGCLLWEPSC